MATRVETEFSRWDRLYRRVWEKVRADAEAANERRARSQATTVTTTTAESGDLASTLHLALSSSLSLSPSTPGSRFFTPHHRLWRALVSLFITVLSHVRLPLEVGDRICEMLAGWIALFVGPEYYFITSRTSLSVDDASGEGMLSVEDAIRAMEAWNVDLTWFIFMQHRLRADGVTAGNATNCGGATNLPLSDEGEQVRLAEVAF